MDVTPYCSSAGFDAASPVLSEIHSTLASLDVNVEQVLDIEFFFPSGLQQYIAATCEQVMLLPVI